MNNESQPKLSILAQFDDMCRFTNSLLNCMNEQDVIKEFIENCEKNRIDWLSDRESVKELEKQNQCLKLSLSQMKSKLKKINKKKENLKNQINQIREKLNYLKEIIENNKNLCGCDQNKKQLLSHLDIKFIDEELESNSDEYSSFQEITGDMSSEKFYEIIGDSTSDLQTLIKQINITE